MIIHKLADEIASQIAAGEVVERPASVVKELMENAIDADATKIGIRIENAGKTLVEVSDNGTGIPFAQMELAVDRHSTSKLQTAADLFQIHTLGFRGEALASIGSVSRMAMTSRCADQKEGGQINVDGGKFGHPVEVGIPVGTVVKVNDLFYNTPARLNFLKKDQTEKQLIETMVVRYALAYPERAVELILDDKPILQTSGNGDRREILAKLYGSDLSRQMLEVIFEGEGIHIAGFISPISVTRSNRKEITFFVNGRWIQDIALSTALLRAYQSYLMVGRYPVTFLFITLDTADVDVNVHPAKAEVRFKQPDLLFSVIQRAVRRALLAYSPVPQLTPASWQSTIEPSSQVNAPWGKSPLDWNSGTEKAVSTSHDQPVIADEQKNEIMPLLRLIGQIGAVYLVAEGPDGLYLVDQHAAHERILYEKMTDRTQPVNSQSLLEPQLIHLDPSSARLVKENLTTLNSIGFIVDEFGSNTFRISAIPSIFIDKDPIAAIRSIVEDFEEDEAPLKGFEDARIIARICKRMAVKGGQVLAIDEQQALLRQLEACKAPRTCPHGRPTMIHLSVDLLERQFGRRGAR